MPRPTPTLSGSCKVVSALALLAAGSASAIVIRHDTPSARYEALGERYEAVADMNLPGGAGVLIAPEWVLTAAHVARLMKEEHNITLGGRRYPVGGVVIYPGGAEGRDDLALVRLAGPVREVAPMRLYDGDAGAEMVVTFAGRGMSGDGLTGPVIRDGKLRAARNRVSAVHPRLLVFRFDPPETAVELEGISGPGDSGGPAIVVAGDAQFVAGISSGQDSRATGKEGVYGVTEYYTRVSAYLDWIHAVMAARPNRRR